MNLTLFSRSIHSTRFPNRVISRIVFFPFITALFAFHRSYTLRILNHFPLIDIYWSARTILGIRHWHSRSHWHEISYIFSLITPLIQNTGFQEFLFTPLYFDQGFHMTSMMKMDKRKIAQMVMARSTTFLKVKIKLKKIIIQLYTYFPTLREGGPKDTVTTMAERCWHLTRLQNVEFQAPVSAN